MEYNVSELFFDAFGIQVSKAYSPEVESGKPKGQNLDYSTIELVEEDEAVELSFLNTPIIYPVTFVGQKYKVYNNDGQIVYQRMEDFRLPITCIVDFDREKVIGKTKINSNPAGTVKETFGFDDWIVTIKGFCLLDESQQQGYITAIDQEAELMQWESIVDSIEVRGKLFSVRDISHLVIQKIPMQSLRGKPNVRPFTIRALSDEPLDLIL